MPTHYAGKGGVGETVPPCTGLVRLKSIGYPRTQQQPLSGASRSIAQDQAMPQLCLRQAVLQEFRPLL